jgi:hypothetical protein
MDIKHEMKIFDERTDHIANYYYYCYARLARTVNEIIFNSHWYSVRGFFKYFDKDLFEKWIHHDSSIPEVTHVCVNYIDLFVHYCPL